MRTRACLPLALACLLTAAPAPAQDKAPPAASRPLLRLEAGGPTSNVTALAFSPDGRTLYAAGFDKVVRVWRLDPKTGRFELHESAALRVPLGPGLRGALNALALSPDGKLLAAGGLGVVRGGEDYDGPRVIVPKTGGMTAAMRADEGQIFVFETGGGRLRHTLRGHTGAVRSLAFAPAQKGKPPLLISAARGHPPWDAADASEVRVWDVARGAQVGGPVTVSDPEGKPPPALAAWHTGAGLDQLRVAIAAGDGKLRVWDLAARGAPAAYADGRYNSTLAVMPGGKRLLSGSVHARKPASRLLVRDLTGKLPTLTGQQSDLGPTPKDSLRLPTGLAVREARADGEADHVAVVVTDARVVAGVTRFTFSLELRELTPGADFGKRKASVPLWQGEFIWPSVAAAPGGAHVAVAGSPDHRILVYQVADLVAGGAKPQDLRSTGAGVGRVRFAHRTRGKATETGLILQTAEGGGPLTFNFSSGALTSGRKGWTADQHDAGAWAVRREDDRKAGTVLRVLRAGAEWSAFTFRAPVRVKDFLLLPPRGDVKVPLLVVAAYDVANAEPQLDVFNASTREHVVRFAGHLGPVNSLGVSADGRLLASASDDQTVCVWGLAGVARALKQAGGLKGLAVTDGPKGGVVVASVAADSPAAGTLRAGMVIEGLVKGGKLHPLTSPHAFYESLWRHDPGMRATYQVREVKGKAARVTLKVRQGTEEQRPLLTLFVTRPGAGGRRDWVGWHTRGFYDANRPEAERHLGWHFNTGKADDPASFALIGEYRKGSRQKGLLRELVARGNLEEALKALKPPPPPPPAPVLKLSVLVDGKEVAPDEDGQVPVRSPRVTLWVTAGDFRPREGDALEWRLGGGKPQPLEERAPDLWAADLELPAGKAALHTVEAAVRLREHKDRRASPVKVTVRYQPPAPVLEYSGPRHLTVKEKTFDFKARVRPGLDGVAADVTLVHEHKGKQVQKAAREVKGKPEEIREKLTLRPGENLIAVRARNRGALADHAVDETAELTVKVTYEPVKVARPAIALDAVVPLAKAGALPPVPIELTPEAARAVVDVPRVRLKGTIKAAEGLELAQWQAGKGGKQKLPGFKAGGKEYPIDLELNLEPGPQEFRFRAKTPNSEAAEETLTLLYRPRLPVLTLLPPVPGSVLYEPGDEDARTIDLEGKTVWPADRPLKPFRLEATLLVRGAPVGKPFAVPAAGLKISGVPLKPGDNPIVVRLTHAWGGKPSVAEVNVRYLRPPRVLDLKVQAPPVPGKPTVAVIARVSSPLRPLDDVTLEVNGEPVPKAKAAVKGGKGRAWEVELPAVPVSTGPNEIRLWVSNAEGKSRQAGLLKLTQKGAEPPAVTLLAPSESGRAVSDRELKLRFRVKSAVALTRVEVRKGDKVLFSGPAAALGEGEREFEAPLLLDWGINELRVEAANAGGPRLVPLTVNAVRQPVRVDIEKLTVQDPGGKVVATLDAPAAGGHFGKAAQPRVWVHGTVRWAGRHYRELDEPQTVRLYVNGFRQPPVTLAKRDGKSLERTFKAPVLLSARGNRVEVALPGLEVRADERNVGTVECAAPGPAPEFHVVLLAPRQPEAAELERAVRKALAPGEKKKAYRVRVYPPLTQESNRSHVFGLLSVIRDTVATRVKGGFPSNDVVLVYYRGAETEQKSGHFFWMPGTRAVGDAPDTAVELGKLGKLFDGCLGAQVVLLDVTPEPAVAPSPGEVSASWGVDYRFGVLRHRWFGKAGAPGSGRLLEGLGAKLPAASGLRELARLLAERFRELPPAEGPSLFDEHLPPGLDVRLAP
jgi:WD40 repeat protein